MFIFLMQNHVKGKLETWNPYCHVQQLAYDLITDLVIYFSRIFSIVQMPGLF